MTVHDCGFRVLVPAASSAAGLQPHEDVSPETVSPQRPFTDAARAAAHLLSPVFVSPKSLRAEGPASAASLPAARLSFSKEPPRRRCFGPAGRFSGGRRGRSHRGTGTSRYGTCRHCRRSYCCVCDIRCYCVWFAPSVQAYTIIDHLVNVKFNVHLISRSATETGASIRQVQSETVWGNAMYALKDCCCLLPTMPANLVDKSLQFDGVFVAGGQCPYYMMQDPAVTAILDSAPFAAAVCHGPEALIGSKWLHPPDGKVGPFISYYGAWMSFRDVHGYERRKPGEICEDASSRLFTGNAPNSTKALVIRACEAISASKA